MSSDKLSPTGYEFIRKFLNSTHIHYTATEMFEFFEYLGLKTSSKVRKFEVPFTKSTIRSFLKNLANTGEIQAQQIEGKRDKRYFANRVDELKYVELEIVGFYIQHYDKKKLLDNILERYSDIEMSYGFNIGDALDKRITLQKVDKDREALLGDEEKRKKITFFEATCMMNYYEIPKLVGINPFRRIDDKKPGVSHSPPEGIQRPRDKDWVYKLKTGLSSKLSAILNNAIIFFNKDSIEEIEPIKKREDGLYTWKIRVPYYDHIFDDDKPGYILDGQQRMWALDLINIERIFKNEPRAKAFYGPVTVLIGEFGDELEYEMEILRLYFILANNTKNLPPKLRDELSALMNTRVQDALPPKQREKGYFEKIINLLESEKISPFYRAIDHDVVVFYKRGSLDDSVTPSVRKFAGKGVEDMVKTILKGSPFNYNPKATNYLDVFKVNYEKWAHMIMDYFNAIKCIFNTEWNELDTVIRRNMGVLSLGQLMGLAFPPKLLRKSRNQRVKILIQDLAIWKIFDDELDLSSKSNLIATITRDKKDDAKTLFEAFQTTFLGSSAEPEDSDDVIEEIAAAEMVWEEIKAEAGVEGEKF